MLEVNRLRSQDKHNLMVVKAASAIAIIIGGWVLVGWWLDIDILKSGFPGSPATMKVNTALCFVLSGLSLWLSLGLEKKTKKEQAQKKIRSLLCLGCAIAVILIPALTIIQYLFGWNFGIDELLFRDLHITSATSHPGRMGVNTALNFILVGSALGFITFPKTQRSCWYSQILALIAALIALQSLIGYTYQVKILYGIAPFTTSMALHTALLFTALCIGILWRQTKSGLMKVVTNDNYGGLLARRLLLAAIAVPFFVGWLIVAGWRAGYYDPAFALSLFAIVLIVIFVTLVWQSAVAIERLSYQRDRVQETLRAYEQKLTSFVDSNVIGILFGDVYGNIQQANDELLGMIGYTQEDLLTGKLNWLEITPPEYLYLDEQGIAEAKANAKGACTPYEKEYIHKNGSRIPVLIGYVLLGEKREESVAFIINLSQQRKTQAEQQKLVSLIEHSSDLIGIANLDGESLYLNSAGQKLVGLANLTKTKILDYLMPEDKGYFQEYILPTVITQGYWQGEFRLHNFQTGQAIPVDYHIFTITDNKNQPIALASMTRNISEQKQAQEKIIQLNKDLQRRIVELQTLLEMIPIGIGIAEDPQCKIIKTNSSFAKQLGISTHINASLTAPIDQRPTFKIYKEGRELSSEELPMQYSAANGVEVLDFEVDIVHEDGKIVNLLEYVAPLFDEDGNTRGCIGAFLDITVRKQAEEVVRNQQKWLEVVLNLMPRPLLFIEPGTAKVTFANRSAHELAGGEFPTGVPAEEYHTAYHFTDAAGDGSGKRIPNDQMPGVRVARGERLDALEVDWHTCDGVRSLLIFADTLPAMYGYPATCVLVFQDVSNLKQVEKAMSLGYERLQLLFSIASDLLCSQQPIALIDSVFSKLADQIGLDVYFNYLIEDESAQVMQLASYRGISPELAKEIEWLKYGQAVCGTVAQKRYPIAVENVQQSTDLKTELIRSLGITAYYCSPLIAQGKILGTLSFGSRSRSFFTDNQKGMMQAVCDQIAIALERADLIASLQQQTEQLTQANRMKDEFLAILSHELRSPLNAILGWSQLLRARKLSDAQTAKGLETIERNAKAQTQLIEDLLDISRMIRGKLRLNVRTCNLISIIESAIETVNLAAEAKEIDLKLSLFTERETPNENSTSREAQCQCHDVTPIKPQLLISGDGERLQQIIWNLLSNAIKFTPRGGAVEIKLAKIIVSGEEIMSNGKEPPLTASYAQIQVIDTGIGINSNFLPYVFDRFRQADSSSTRTHGGLGLGLAIVRHLVELHGGTVHVDSPGEEKGATFTVNLPLLPPSKENIRSANQENLAPLPFCPSLDGVRVLVVDDEADSREFITTVLQQCQAQVQAVSSVQEALQAITQWKPDVLVSDIGMPQEDGYSLIRQVRSQPPEQGGKIPAAALTAYARAEDRMRAIQEGYQIHLPKPVEPAELATVVASLVRKI